MEELILFTSGLVCNQTYEDNEMMKKLLLCSKTCQDEDNLEESDDADVIVESLQEKSHPMKSFRREMENLENLNFNYDVIVKFVKQGKYQLALAGFIVISCAETRPRLSVLSPTFSGMRVWRLVPSGACFPQNPVTTFHCQG